MNEKPGYWQRYWRKRLTRRGLLRGTALGAAGLAAAAVVGCGDDDEAPAATTPAATTPAATATATPTPVATPKQGGTLRQAASSGPSTLDPDKTSNYVVRINTTGKIYSKLYQQVGVHWSEYPPTTFAPDAAESMPEVTDDGLTYIIKLRSNVKYTAPLSRAMDSDDVVHAYKRMMGEIEGTDPSPTAGALSIVEKMEATDSHTVVFKLKKPLSTFINRIGDDFNLNLTPKEIGDAFDPVQQTVGSGPWILKDYQQDVSLTWIRNPEWHQGPSLPHLDGIDTAIVPEYTSRLNQFLAGNLDSAGTIPPTDLKDIADTYPDATWYSILSGYSVALGFSGTQEGPWQDKRVRQAISMAIDRDSLFEALYSPSLIEAAGLEPPEIKYHSHINAGFRGYWIDPRTDPNMAPYFEHNVEKAKALLAEAGYPDGFDVRFHYTKGYGPVWTLHAELMLQMLGDIGLNVEAVPEDFRSEYYPKTFRGDFDGIGVFYLTQTEPGDLLEQVYLPGGARNFGKIDDPVLTDEVNKIQVEFDFEKRRQMIRDIQPFMAEQMYYVPGAHDAGPSWTAWHPRIRNAGRYLSIRGGSGENQLANLWIA